MNIKNKWQLRIIIGIGLIIFVCVVVPFFREKYIYWRLGYVDIAPILIRKGDLPPSFKAGDITDVEPYYYNSARVKEQEILALDGSKVGNVKIYLFASRSEQGDLFAISSQVESQEGIIPYDVKGIGECETCSSIFATDYGVYVVFTRCAALVTITLPPEYIENKSYDFDYLVSHAKRLDENLKLIACY